MVRTMFLVFWFPLAVAGLFAWIGYELGEALAWKDPSVAAVIGGLLGLAIGLLAVYRVGKGTEAGAGLTISRVLLDEEGANCNSRLPLEESPPIP